jgi:hypothetical protein
MRIYSPAVLALLILRAPHALAAEPAAPPADAFALYIRASESIKALCPAASNLSYPDYPPFGPAWMQLAHQAWDKNAAARDLARQARAVKAERWPTDVDDRVLLNRLRRLSNELADAALYQQTQANHAAAFDLATDDLRLAETLERGPARSLLHALVAGGMAAQATNRVLVLTSDVTLTRDPSDTLGFQVAAAHQLIARLLDQRDAADQLVDVLGPKDSPKWKDPKVGVERQAETLNRANAERTFAAMSLACHLYRFDKGAWPESLDQLFPDYLPRIPKDPWGDGKQTFGYALIKSGLPSGDDRPLVYSRCNAVDGLRYRTDEPEYGFYNAPRIQTPTGPRIQQTGQFRDIARWHPAPGADNGATLQPLK